MFNVATGMWTWVSGSKAVDQVGVYGQQRVPAIGNSPGARRGHSMSINTRNQVIYVFGGYTNNYMNDLWMFNVTTSWWTWLTGSSSGFQVGTYGTLGVGTADNVPGARHGHSMLMDTDNQAMYMMFGFGRDATGSGPGGAGYMNDLWMFNVTTGWWTWLAGKSAVNPLGAYERGTGVVGNVPGGRFYHSMTMDTVHQIIYMSGGQGYGASGSDGTVKGS